MIATDALVIGAGPVGLFQVFELGLLGLHAQVIDSLPEPGGQCITLYADKPIYDIPATQVVTGRELVARLLAQIAPFKPDFHLNQQVDVVERQGDGRFRVVTSKGTELLAKTIVIAGGVGSFQPRRLKIEGLQSFEGTQLFYTAPDSSALAAQRVVVIGDDEAALECALALAAQRAPVTLMHRRDEFRAAPATIARVRAQRASGQLNFVAAQATGIEQAAGRLVALKIAAADGSTPSLPLDALIVLTGLSPKLGP
ncbi:MAG TPA: NAD(P)/FAD-dependent oxidoreductase, partial [Burkholderiaceae bacterium]